MKNIVITTTVIMKFLNIMFRKFSKKRENNTLNGRSETSKLPSVVGQGNVLDALLHRQMAKDGQSPAAIFGNVGLLGLGLLFSKLLLFGSFSCLEVGQLLIQSFKLFFLSLKNFQRKNNQ
jgi:hypothetical protein